MGTLELLHIKMGPLELLYMKFKSFKGNMDFPPGSHRTEQFQ
jgi:hypothetical protein